MHPHEYSVICGLGRVHVGRYLTILAGIVSAGSVFFVLQAYDVAERYGVPKNIPPSIFSLLGSGGFFALFYFLLDKFIWKMRYFNIFLKIPNLNGEWVCKGETLSNEQKVEWNAVITIVQSWDKIKIRLKTDQSASHSIAASLIYDEGIGYRLLYNYRNDPNIENPHLKSHTGFADIEFSEDLRTAKGMYFNGNGRITYGVMKLNRSVK